MGPPRWMALHRRAREHFYASDLDEGGTGLKIRRNKTPYGGSPTGELADRLRAAKTHVDLRFVFFDRQAPGGAQRFDGLVEGAAAHVAPRDRSALQVLARVDVEGPLGDVAAQV